ncbi:MAG TPA: formyltetrahydrofolate deformylase [Verrucomicrobiae bacterium]|jgi:formyltetrahydrofolate deformylase|nr:formyltetrahydrofolate deformylase [Verrucomicrobiae bacterium]
MKEFAILTVIGRDKTGVVARITSFLFERRANIEALEEQVTRGQFSMTLQASWPAHAIDKPALNAGLGKLAAELGMEIKVRWTDPKRRQRMAVMVTAEPHCALALLEAVKAGRLPVHPAVMISNRRDLAPIARDFKLPFTFVSWNDRPAAEKRTLQLLEEHEVDFVVLARFMKILSPNFVWRYKNKIINIHPSLLPSFPGPQAYRQAYEYGVKIIGVTSHFVSMRLDEGPILAQAGAPIPSNATLKEIIATGQALECKVLIKAVRLYLTKRLDVHWGVVKEV